MYTPFKMKGKSPMMKALIGKQSRLPEHLKAKILAAPESPTKMKRKSPVKDGRKHDHPHDRINGVPGSGLEGMGKDGRPMKKKSPAKATSRAAKNLLKAVPNKKAYEKLSDIDKKGFDKAAKKAGLPTKAAATKKIQPKVTRSRKDRGKKKIKNAAVKGAVKGAVGSMTQSMTRGPVEKKYTKKLGSKTKMLKGTTVFGKEVNKKNLKKAEKKVRRVLTSAATGGISELARKAAKTKVGKSIRSKVVKGVKKVYNKVKEAANSGALQAGGPRRKKVSDARKKASKRGSRMSSGGGASR